MTTTKPQWIKRRWEPRELVLIGVFAAAAKLSSLLIALAGGGMNPISLLGKNLVYTTLMIVLLTKVPKLLDAHALYRGEHARKRPAFGRKSDASPGSLDRRSSG